jgi:hypothetical protein
MTQGLDEFATHKRQNAQCCSSDIYIMCILFVERWELLMDTARIEQYKVLMNVEKKEVTVKPQRECILLLR